MNAQRQKAAVAWLSVISNSTLVLFKLLVGLWIGSVSVISEAIHSGMDLVASVIALVAVNTAGKPADTEHPFGHGKVENVSGAVEALLIFLAAAWIVYEAVKKLLGGRAEMGEAGWGVAVMLISVVANTIVSQLLFKVGKKTESVALEADAWHLRTDVYTSLGVMLGLGIIWGGRFLFPGLDLHWVDPVAALVVAALILRAAWDLTMKSSRDLLDASLPKDEEAWIRNYISRLQPTIRGFHNLRTRRAGTMRFIDFHLIVEAEMSVFDSHRISDVMTCDIEDHFPDASVTIHVEPCDGQCKSSCVNGCFLSMGERLGIRQALGVSGATAGESDRG